MKGLIPQNFIDELISRVDIVALIDSYLPLRKLGTAFVAVCPFHQEKSPSFNVVESKQFYHCFGCGVSGNAISFIMNYLKKPFPEAVKLLALRVGLKLPEESGRDFVKQSSNLYEFMGKVRSFYQELLREHHPTLAAYLLQRQLSTEIIELFQLGYAPTAWQTLERQFKTQKPQLLAGGLLVQKESGKTYDRYRGRLIFPIHDRHGKVIGFGGRALEPGQKPKYLNSPETAIFQKNRELYGLYQSLQVSQNPPSILVVEGYLDVIALHQYGFTAAVATLGTATSSFHIQLLSKYTKKIFFCFDGDAAGRAAAWLALEHSLPQMHLGLDLFFVFLPEGQDPDTMLRLFGKASFQELLVGAKRFNEYFYENLLKGIDLATMAGKSQLVHVVKPYLNKVDEGAYKTLLMDDLSRLTHIEPYRLNELIAEKIEWKPMELGQDLLKTPVKIAMALLVQNPGLVASSVRLFDFSSLNFTHQTLLQRLIHAIAANPDIHSAALVELWRDTPYFDLFNRLAVWNHQVAEAVMQEELIDILRFLVKQETEDKIKSFLEKVRQGIITDQEREALNEMLKQRHKVNKDFV